MTKNNRPAVLDAPAANLVEHNINISDSAEFRAWLSRQRTDAQRRADDLATEINHLEAAIQARSMEHAEAVEIVKRCDAALTIDLSANRPAPQLTPHDEVKAALEQQGGDS